MANWCSNTVEFIGEHSQFTELESLFNAMAKKEKKEERGQLPEFAKDGSGYFFEISWEDGILYYQTKWAPNTDSLVKIAEHFKAGFTYSYAEPGMGVFGEASYSNGELTDICLDQEDTAQYEYDEPGDTYRFENQNYESSDDILEILLERKKAARRQQELNENTNQQTN